MDLANTSHLDETDLKHEVHVSEGYSIKLKPIQIRKLMALKFWYIAQPTHTLDTWVQFSPSILSQYAPSASSPFRTPPTSPALPTSTMSTTSSPMVPHTPSMDFTKSVKRAITDYPLLNDDKQFHDWNFSFKAIALMHGVSNVLNKHYVPSTHVDSHLFTAHKNFVFGVFSVALKTVKSRNILKAHQDTADSQAVYISLLLQYTQGATAVVQINTLRHEILAFRLTDTWTKPLVTYMTQWTKKVGDLSTLQGFPVPDQQKKTWLNDAIITHPDLSQALTQIHTIESINTTMANTTVTLTWH